MNTHSTPGPYFDELLKVLRKIEKFESLPYDDGVKPNPNSAANVGNNPTIGDGINLRVDSYLALVLRELAVFQASDALAPVGETEAQRNTRYDQILDGFEAIIDSYPASNTGNAALQSALNAELQQYISAGVFSLTEPQSANIVRSILEGFVIGPNLPGPGPGAWISDSGKEARLDARLNLVLFSLPHDTKEYLALMSMFYNVEGTVKITNGNLDPSDDALVGRGILTALAAGDRASTWWEIRYNSNGGSSQNIKDGIAKRRYYEAQMFGLYDPGVSADNILKEDAISVYQMYTKHRSDILKYELSYSSRIETNPRGNANQNYNLIGGPDEVQTLEESLGYAYDFMVREFLISANVTDVVIDELDIQVGTGEANTINGTHRRGYDRNAATERNDLIIGLAGNDEIHGADGSDVLYGDGSLTDVSMAAGNDLLFGDAGRDHLFGGGGVDHLDGGADTDRLHGGGDADYLAGGAGADFLFGDDGIDVLVGGASQTVDDGIADYLNGGAGQDIYYVGMGDTIVDGDGGQVYYNGTFHQLTDTWTHHANGDYYESSTGLKGIRTDSDGNGTLDSFQILGSFFTISNFSEGNFGITFEDEAPPSHSGSLIFGTDFDDRSVDSDPDYDDINGTPGDDEVHGLAGHDHIYGGYGRDLVYGDAGDDFYVSYGAGGYYALEDTAPDEVHGGLGRDVLAGSQLDDRFYGDEGDDLLTPFSGDDLLDGGGGNDILAGWLGDDVLIGGEGDDALLGGGFFNLNNSEDEDWSFEFTYHSAGFISTLSVTNVFEYYQDDALDGSDLILAGAGSDYVFGGYGDDFLYGEADNDTLSGGAGEDVLEGGAGTDWLFGDSSSGAGSADYLDGGTGDDFLFGYGGNDQLEGGAGNDHLQGGDGDDYLHDVGGNNVLAGEAGNDVLIGGANHDELQGGDGDDQLDGGAGDDTLFGEQGDDVLIGGLGNDQLVAGEGADLLFGDDGDDQLWGDAGDDTLDGGAGSNVLRGGDGNDVLLGDGGDTLIGEAGNDTYFVGGVAEGGFRAVIIDTSGQNSLHIQAAVGLGEMRLHIPYSNSVWLETAVDGSTPSVTIELDGETFNTFDGVSFGDGSTQQTLSISELRHTFDPGYVSDPGLSLASGVAAAEVTYSASNDDLLLVYSGSLENWIDTSDLLSRGVMYEVADGSRYGMTAGTKVLALVNWFQATQGQYVQQLVDTQGNTFDFTVAAASLPASIDGGSGDDNIDGTYRPDRIRGYEGDDSLNGDGGNDVIEGGSGADLIDGGAGDDILNGGDGDDFYVFGYGHDNDRVADSSGTNQIGLGAGINASNVTFYRLAFGPAAPGDAMVLRLDQTGEQILVENFYSPTPSVEIQFWDGSALTAAEVEGVSVTVTHPANGESVAGTLGDDTFFVDHPSDVITEQANQGIDTVSSSVTYALPANVENLVLTGALAINGVGNALTNSLTGNSAGNTLDGGDGADTMAGGAGRDTYVVNGALTPDDTVIEIAGEGYDRLIARNIYSVTLADNVEELIIDGVLANPGILPPESVYRRFTGNALDNVIDARDAGSPGNRSEYILDGGSGADMLIGGSADNRFIVDNTGDVVVGWDLTDTVVSSIAYALPDAIEHLELSGSAAISGTGNAFNNVMWGSGNSAANVLIGLSGDDEYHVGLGDTVVENEDQGLDFIFLEFDRGAEQGNLHSLADYQNAEIMYAGEAAGNATLIGTAGDNALVGNSLENVLIGGASDDRLSGRGGYDTYGGFGMGSGHDTIDLAYRNTTDAIRFSVDSSVVLANIEYSKVASQSYGSFDLLIKWSESDSIRIDKWFSDSLAINDIVFYSEGLAYTYNSQQLNALLITHTNSGPRANAYIPDLTASVGAAFSYQIAGNVFSDIESQESLQYSVTMQGGAPLPAWMSFDEVTRTLSGTPTNGDLGSLTFEIRATDEGGLSNAFLFQLSVDPFTIVGTAGNDHLIGDALPNALDGLAGDDLLEAASGADKLYGRAGNDTLDGGPGVDVMYGGDGDDIYIVDSTSDSAIELEGELSGTDTVRSSATYTLGANIENIELTGSGAVDGYGNSLNNVLTGNTGANKLTGGEGDDIYLVGSGDTVREFANEGDDTVRAAFSYTLASQVENLELLGTGAINGTGNTLANQIVGNSGNNRLDGAAGDDILVGGTGDDTYVAGTGDTFVELSGEGTDTVESSATWALGDHLENLTLTGSASVNATGNSVANALQGNSGSNVLTGLAGDDVYYVGTGDTVVEAAAEGTDTVMSGVAWTLAANVENLTLTGSSGVSGTGNTGDNVLTGNSGTNTLTGGAGNDTYYVGTGDTVAENASQGTDIVFSAVTWTLAANVENLTLTGSSNVNATGNSTANTIVGNSGNNTLTGGGGTDTLVGGAGNDIYVVDDVTDIVTELTGEGTDTVQTVIAHSLGANIENLTLTGSNSVNGTGNGFANVLTGNTGNNRLDGGAGIDTLVGGTGNDTYVIDDVADVVTEASSAGTDVVESSVTYTLATNVENLLLTGTANINGTGNSAVNQLTGNSGNNRLNGGSGADTLIGGAGDDTYVVDSTSDVVTEGSAAGTDTIESTVTFTASANVENLTLTGSSVISATGNTLDNVLTGNSAANTLTGGAGNDSYYVGTGDTVTESASQGTDTVFSGVVWTLGSNIENLTLTGASAVNGTGNTLDNVLTGNSAANVLTGGTGNDTYYVSTGDTTTESASAGTDSVFADVSWTLAVNLENLTLTGTGNTAATGNTVANVLTGNSGNNTLDGLGGADTMSGGLGDDIYIVDNASDVVTESASQGFDTVQTALVHTLANNVEALLLTGSSAVNGTGNALNNVLTGNSGANVLTGAAGDDTYFVGTGDSVVESASQGTDTVNSGIAWTLGINIENLTLTGSSAINGTGNALDNVLTGNTGINTLTGATGNDTYVVSTGDVVVETSGQGTDSVVADVTWTLVNEVENLTLAGAGNINGTGNSVANQLVGNGGNNTLTGLGGNDTYTGGAGNDLLQDSAGNETYSYETGHGLDTILDDTGTDQVSFGAGISSSNVVARLADHGGTQFAEIRFLDGNGDEIAGQGLDIRATGGVSAIESFHFVGGEILTFDDLINGSGFAAKAAQGSDSEDAPQSIASVWGIRQALMDFYVGVDAADGDSTGIAVTPMMDWRHLAGTSAGGADLTAQGHFPISPQHLTSHPQSMTRSGL